MKHTIGIIMMLMFFIGIFVAIAVIVSIKQALIIFAVTTLCAVWITVSGKLINK